MRPGTLLAIGETMALVTPDTAESLVEARYFLLDAGGAESNVAAHVTAEGHTARWFSRVGADVLGERITRQLAARGIDVSGVVRDPANPTGLYVKDPGRGVLYFRRGSAASRLAPPDADALALDGVDIVHLSGITPVLSTSAAAFVDRVMQRARQLGVPVSFDVNHRPALWDAATAAPVLLELARLADIVFTGGDEAETLWRAEDDDAVRAVLPDVLEVVVKDVDLGATSYCGTTRAFEPALHVEVVEAVGAGDAFAGGYLSALLSGADISERLRAGHRRAAHPLQTMGTPSTKG